MALAIACLGLCCPATIIWIQWVAYQKKYWVFERPVIKLLEIHITLSGLYDYNLFDLTEWVAGAYKIFPLAVQRYAKLAFFNDQIICQVNNNEIPAPLQLFSVFQAYAAIVEFVSL